jgi:hypothetical protein
MRAVPVALEPFLVDPATLDRSRIVTTPAHDAEDRDVAARLRCARRPGTHGGFFVLGAPLSGRTTRIRSVALALGPGVEYYEVRADALADDAAAELSARAAAGQRMLVALSGADVKYIFPPLPGEEALVRRLRDLERALGRGPRTAVVEETALPELHGANDDGVPSPRIEVGALSAAAAGELLRRAVEQSGLPLSCTPASWEDAGDALALFVSERWSDITNIRYGPSWILPTIDAPIAPEDLVRRIAYQPLLAPVSRTAEERRRTALHEAGHAAVDVVLFGASSVRLAITSPSSDRALVATRGVPARWRYCDIGFSVAGLAGRAAEEAFFGAAGSGACTDAAQAWSRITGQVAAAAAYIAEGSAEITPAEMDEFMPTLVSGTADRVFAACLSDARDIVIRNRAAIEVFAGRLDATGLLVGPSLAEAIDAAGFIRQDGSRIASGDDMAEYAAFAALSLDPAMMLAASFRAERERRHPDPG